MFSTVVHLFHNYFHQGVPVVPPIGGHFCKTCLAKNGTFCFAFWPQSITWDTDTICTYTSMGKVSCGIILTHIWMNAEDMLFLAPNFYKILISVYKKLVGYGMADIMTYILMSMIPCFVGLKQTNLPEPFRIENTTFSIFTPFQITKLQRTHAIVHCCALPSVGSTPETHGLYLYRQAFQIIGNY